MADKKRVDLHLPIDIFNELKIYAEGLNISITTLLKLIIQEYLRKHTDGEGIINEKVN